MSGKEEENTLKTCIICEEEKEKGFHLYTSFICIDCEKEIVQTETNQNMYKYYIKQLSKVIYNQNIVN